MVTSKPSFSISRARLDCVKDLGQVLVVDHAAAIAAVR
jgi:hypothetical protein